MAIPRPLARIQHRQDNRDAMRARVAFGAIFIVVCVGAYYFDRPHVSVVQGAGREHWEQAIKTDGGPAAYEEFADAVKDLSPQKQHSSAHDFGGALFKTKGVSGLSVCDSRFNFGCFHEFLGEAIATLGLGVVEQLNDSCFKDLGNNGLACQHGIGHGVMAYEGYTDSALDKALATCKSLPHNDPVGGCYGGVFMEYNLQTMLGEDARLRPGIDHPYAPCDRLDSAYQAACVFWQPQWWNISLRQTQSDTAKRFAQLGGWCTHWSGTLERKCFEGIGNIAIP
jgi:hypothetical protein